MREIRMLRTTWRELETELRDGLRHRHEAKAAGKRLLPVPTATAPALDPTGGGLAGAIPPGYPAGARVNRLHLSSPAMQPLTPSHRRGISFLSAKTRWTAR